ncbi:MAG: hypothetical protein QG559_774 [Campylobacterota bacterium]|nr:hypothetical protein [Campylobacterota bacterium]
MFNTIIEASRNFCIHQIRVPHQVHDNVPQMRTIIAFIDAMPISGKKYRVYLAASFSFAQRVATTLLEEDESDEETLIDMMLESANLIVGSAKVLAEEKGYESFIITTPSFENIDAFSVVYDEAKVLKIEDDEMIIAIKEI